MLANVLRRVAATAARRPAAATATRAMATSPFGSDGSGKTWSQNATGSAYDDPNVPNDEGVIGTFRDQATGIGRAQELIMDSYGMDLFDRDAVYADGDQGTFEEPICILSHTNHRIVGVSFPEDSEVRWFTLFDGYKAFDPVSCNFFALRTVPIEELDEFVRSAEWDEHKDRFQRPGVVPN